MKDITTVLIAEDHAVVREAVASLIAGLAEFKVVASVDSGAATLTAVAELKPDMLVLDLHLPDISGLEVLRQLRAAGTNLAILILTSSDSDHTVRQSIALGARGYFVKVAALRPWLQLFAPSPGGAGTFRQRQWSSLPNTLIAKS